MLLHSVKTLGFLPKQMFPQTEDPASKLKDRGISVKIVLLEYEGFTKEVLKLGFHKMKNQGRERWLGAIKSQRFCLQKLAVGTEVTVGDVMSLTHAEVDVAVKTIAAEIESVFGPDISPTNVQPSDNETSGQEPGTGESGSDSDSSSEEEDD